MEPDPDEIEPIEDGQVVNPHGMDPQTVLRFVKTVGGWPGKVIVVACEPASGRGDGPGLSPEVADAVERAVTLVLETIDGAPHRRRLRGGLTCTSSRSRARSSTPPSATLTAAG